MRCTGAFLYALAALSGWLHTQSLASAMAASGDCRPCHTFAHHLRARCRRPRTRTIRNAARAPNCGISRAGGHPHGA